jgi:tetratricopeptide (TPR) repeat protein
MGMLFLAAAAAALSPAQFQQASLMQSASAHPEQQTREVPVDPNISAYYEKMYAKDFALALAAAKRLDPGRDNKVGNALVAVMRASALLGLQKDQDALRLIADAEKLAPRHPDVLTTLFLTTLVADRFDVAADALDRMIAIAPDKVREFESELVWDFLRNEPEGQQQKNQDRRVALAQLGYGGTSEDELTSDAIDILLERGDVAAASELLPYLNDPVSIEEMLLQKRYSALWPRLEEIAGPHMARVAVSALSEAERDYADHPDDARKAAAVVDALLDAGRVEDAIAMRSKVPSTAEALATSDEGMGWLVDSVAGAYLAAGRGEEADELYALLNNAKIEGGWWRVSMRINRLGALVNTGKFEQAIDLLEATEASAKVEGNDYARQLVRRLKFCALSRLGRKQEAAVALTDLLEHAGDAPAPTVDALLCGGQFQEAEKLVMSRPSKGRFEVRLVITLQTRPSSLSAPPPWLAERIEFRRRPAISAEFDRLGRDLPEQFMPAPNRVAAN